MKNGRGKCLAGVMANAGRAENLVIIRGDIKIHVPESCIVQKKGCNRGLIKKKVLAKLQDLSLESAMHLYTEHGIVLEKVNAALTGASVIVPFEPQPNSIKEEMFA